MPFKFNIEKVFKSRIIQKALIFILGLIFIFVGVLIYFELKQQKLEPLQPEPIPTLTNIGDIAKSQKELEDIAKVRGAGVAWEVLKKSADQKAQVHNLAHIVGHLLYQKDGISAFSVCDNSWAYGCYHGFLEGMLQAQGEAAVLKIQEGCSTLKFGASACIHGIGHGLLSWYGYNLEKALGACSQLDSNNQIFCQEGVFMENIQPSMPSAVNPKEEQEKDFNWPCKTFGKQYSIACYHYQSIGLLNVLGWEKIDIVVRNCHTAPTDKVAIGECLVSIGSWVAQMSGGDVTRVESLCRKITNAQDIQQCLKFAANEFAFQRQKRQDVEKLCNLLSGDLIDDCLKKAENTRQEFNL